MPARPRPGPAEEDQASDGQMLRGIVLDLVAKQQALSALIDRCLTGEAGEGDPPATRDLARLMALHSQNAARLGRLLRDKRALTGEDGGEINPAIARALDALAEKWGIDL